MFRPAEDEYHHAEEEGEIFAKLMGITLISLDSNINEDVAEDTQQKQTQEAIVQLDLTEGCRLFVHSRPDTGQSGTAGRETGTDQVPQPDHREIKRIVSIILQHITDLPGKKVKAEGADDEQADGEGGRADHLVFDRQKNNTAEADTETCQNGRK